MLFYSSPSLASYECILFTILFLGTVAPGFLLHSCLDILYATQALHAQSSPGCNPAEINSGDLREELFMAGDATQGSRGLDFWMNGCPPHRCCYSLVKKLHRVCVAQNVNRMVFLMR